MKTNHLLLIIILVSFFACKTKERVSNIDVRATQETLLEESGQRETSGNVSGSMSAVSETSTDRQENQSGGSVHLSVPDSLGKQHPTVINWYSNEIVETSKITAEIKAEFQQIIETLESQISELNSKTEQQNEEQTVSKTGFTFLEKTGFVAIGLLILIAGYTILKWYLKIRKIRVNS